MVSQAKLYQRLQQAPGPEAQRDRALALLEVTHSRQYIDAALYALEHERVAPLLGDAHRGVLRAKASHYFEHEGKDRGGLIREKLLRLLARIGHPDDIDLYLQGVVVYHRQPVIDAAQNLRAAALVGLVHLDDDLGCAYATKLLGEPDTSTLSGEPSMTAITVLASCGRALPVYQFVHLIGRAFIEEGKGEVISRALEVLAADLPMPVYKPLAEQFARFDVPVVSGGLVNAITTHRLGELYPVLEQIINQTHDMDLHRYAVLALAASRDETLTALLYRLAGRTPNRRIKDYIEAVELTAESEARTRLLTLLSKRV